MSNFYCHPGRAGGSPIGLALRILAALLSFAVLIQFFIAGMAAMTNPEWWTNHSTWVGIFQWLVVPLPILAVIGEQPRYWRTAFAIVDSDCIAICVGTSCALRHSWRLAVLIARCRPEQHGRRTRAWARTCADSFQSWTSPVSTLDFLQLRLDKSS